MRMHKNSIKEKKRLDRYPVMMWIGFAYSKIGKTKEENIYIIFKCVKYAIEWSLTAHIHLLMERCETYPFAISDVKEPKRVWNRLPRETVDSGV